MMLAYRSAQSKQFFFFDGLFMKRAAAKIVPKLLNLKQKQLRMNITQEKLTTVSNDPDLLKKIITGDESSEDGHNNHSIGSVQNCPR